MNEYELQNTVVQNTIASKLFLENKYIVSVKKFFCYQYWFSDDFFYNVKSDLLAKSALLPP